MQIKVKTTSTIKKHNLKGMDEGERLCKGLFASFIVRTNSSQGSEYEGLVCLIRSY